MSLFLEFENYLLESKMSIEQELIGKMLASML